MCGACFLGPQYSHSSKYSSLISISDHIALRKRRSMEASSSFLTSSSAFIFKNRTPVFIKPKFLLFNKRSRSQQALRCCSAVAGEDDGAAPEIGGDWRQFRARLVVAGGRDVGDKWAHPLSSPERGCLLIATEKLDGVHIFERTVVLLLSGGADDGAAGGGPVGVILNRPSLMSLKEARSIGVGPASPFAGRPLFFGGPLEEGLFLVAGEGAAAAFERVMEGIYYGTKESVGRAAEMVRRSAAAAKEFRFFDGCCGWESRQLKEEIEAGFWRVAACSASVVGLSSCGGADGGELWEEVSELVGESAAGW